MKRVPYTARTKGLYLSIYCSPFLIIPSCGLHVDMDIKERKEGKNTATHANEKNKAEPIRHRDMPDNLLERNCSSNIWVTILQTAKPRVALFCFSCQYCNWHISFFWLLDWPALFRERAGTLGS